MRRWANAQNRQPDVADVGEVDVPVHDVGHVVSLDLLAQVVGELDHLVEQLTLGRHQGERVLVAEVARVAFGGVRGRCAPCGRPARGWGLGPRPRRLGTPQSLGGPCRSDCRLVPRRWRLAPRVALMLPCGAPPVAVECRGCGPVHAGRRTHRVPVAVDRVEVGATVVGAALGVHGGVQVGAAHRGEAAVGFLPGEPDRPHVVSNEPVVVGQGSHVARDAWVDPGLAGQDVLRVGGQSCLQGEAGCGRDRAEPLQGGPGSFGVDVVGGQRRDPAPVVDACAEQGLALVEVDEVGRRLEAHLWAEHDPGDGERSDVLLEPEVVGVAHRGVGLGAEVLDDDFLDVAVLAGDPAQLEDRLGPLSEVLADADQQAGGEGDREPARVLEHPHPDCRVLVGRAVVGLTLLLEQAARGRLEHHPHGR